MGKYKFVADIGNYQIHCDEHQWILKRKKDRSGRCNTYHPYLDGLLIELLELKTKEYAVKSDKKTIESLGKSYKQAKGEVLELKAKIYENLAGTL